MAAIERLNSVQLFDKGLSNRTEFDSLATLRAMNVHLDELRPLPSAADQAEAQRQLELRQQRQLAMSDTRRAHVLDAARRVFADKGVEGASIREIARGLHLGL